MVDHLRAVCGSNDPSACTDVYRRPDARQPLSKQLWQREPWSLPHNLSEDGTQAVAGDALRVQQFLALHFSHLREEALSGPQNTWMADVKRDYITHACDHIELRFQDQTVGVMVGAPEDWSTYYIRMFALAPRFQKRALGRRFFRECLFEPLAACGVQRVTADTAPTNRTMNLMLTELEFLITGNQLSDRWGPLVRYTKFLDPACESRFLQRFGGATP